MKNLAQRLWVIERLGPASPGEDACRFTGAVALLGDQTTYVLLIRSSHRQGTSEAALQRGHLRFDLERDAFRFATLDDALDWANATKEMWTGRGWVEVTDEEVAAG